MLPSLQGKNILVTREAGQAELFAKQINQSGGNPVIVPLLKITCKESDKAREILTNLSHYNWIFFTSANGVDCFFDLRSGIDSNSVRIHANIATVGEKTSIALQEYGYKANFTPKLYNANTMATDFLQEYTNPGRILLIRGNRSRSVLPEEFRKHGIRFDTLEVYDTHFNFARKKQLNQELRENEIDYITFTSPSTVEAFCEMVDGIPKTVPCICIGSTTSKRAEELGFQYILTPETFTIEGMIHCIRDHIKKG
ncbi:uroporphyrinogen-III synthase [Oceanobacillus kapialis]|uniref:uroporphyrinogen-III synthase n=1 Tax=Oceanobacillus kapialis TaxID=481353 RepID=UPI00384C9D0B